MKDLDFLMVIELALEYNTKCGININNKFHSVHFINKYDLISELLFDLLRRYLICICQSCANKYCI